jgi:hypothetical protein
MPAKKSRVKPPTTYNGAGQASASASKDFGNMLRINSSFNENFKKLSQ